MRFTRAHPAFVPAIMAALPAALNRLFSFLVGSEAVTEVPLTLAHRALAPAAILARAAADMRRFFFGASTEDGIGISPAAPLLGNSSALCEGVREIARIPPLRRYPLLQFQNQASSHFCSTSFHYSRPRLTLWIWYLVSTFPCAWRFFTASAAKSNSNSNLRAPCPGLRLMRIFSQSPVGLTARCWTRLPVAPASDRKACHG